MKDLLIQKEVTMYLCKVKFALTTHFANLPKLPLWQYTRYKLAFWHNHRFLVLYFSRHFEKMEDTVRTTSN